MDKKGCCRVLKTNFIMSRKRLIIIFSTLVVLMGFIFILIILNSFKQTSVKEKGVPTPIPTVRIEQRQKIINEVKDQIETAFPRNFYNVINIRTENGWAVASLEPKDKNYEPGNVILRLENNSWTVVLGPGTSFEEEELINIGAPKMVLEEANNIIVPTPEP